MNQPDYNGSSIVNLMASIRQLSTLPSMYAPLSTLDLSEFEQTDNLVLFLINGLGETTYHQFCEQSPIAPYFRNRLTSVFPTTTAAAVTSIYTGVAPQNHAVLAWFTYLREMGLISTILPEIIRGLKTSYLNSTISAQSILHGNSLFSQFPVKSYTLVPKDVVNSSYNNVFAGTADSDRVSIHRGILQIFNESLH